MLPNNIRENLDDFVILSHALLPTGRDVDPPSLPDDGSWSEEIRKFLSMCLEKDPRRRPDCNALLQTAFIRQAERTWAPGDVGCVFPLPPQYLHSWFLFFRGILLYSPNVFAGASEALIVHTRTDIVSTAAEPDD